MLNGSFFADREPKKSSAIQPHQQLGTVRIGALGNHFCVRNFSFLSDAWTCGYKKGRLNCGAAKLLAQAIYEKISFRSDAPDGCLLFAITCRGTTGALR